MLLHRHTSSGRSVAPTLAGISLWLVPSRGQELENSRCLEVKWWADRETPYDEALRLFALGLTMAASREGVRLARALRQKLPIHQSAPLCARGFASTRAAQNATVKPDSIADIESTSSFSTPQPSKDVLKAFEESQQQGQTERRLPGNRCVLPLQTHAAKLC